VLLAAEPSLRAPCRREQGMHHLLWQHQCCVPLRQSNSSQEYQAHRARHSFRPGTHSLGSASSSPLSHPILQGKPNASHMCARINLHTHDRQNESNTIAVINHSRFKPVRYPLLHPERWTRRSEHNDN
jgi:hypothetical protein